LAKAEQTELGKVKNYLKISDAMLFKRKIISNCSLEVKMLDSLTDGIILTIDQDLVNNQTLLLLTDFVNQNNLNMLLESERYFISSNTLIPTNLHWWDN
jgi:hypothetical protein